MRGKNERGGPGFEALDNGIKSCADPKLMQQLCDGLSADRIDRLLRKWLRRLPHPFPPCDRATGYRYALSILQAEFSLTQVLDQPVTGRLFFEEVIRENLSADRFGYFAWGCFSKNNVPPAPHSASNGGSQQSYLLMWSVTRASWVSMRRGLSRAPKQCQYSSSAVPRNIGF
jgi:hypothetical protein